jgi:hypothetical protein
MSALPPSNTERFKVRYTNQTKQHACVVRTHSVSPGAFGGDFDALMTALTSILPSTVIDLVEYAASGSNIFNPVTTGIEGNAYGSGGGAVIGAAEYLGFVGRSTGGHKARLYVFGINALASNDYRFVAGEVAAIDNAIGLLNAATTVYLAIDGVKPTWKSYANAGVNAHWQKAIRP